ncbi:hypothetical protein SAMN04487831_10988 [Pseudobutyrivibrio sp. UC1225]|uniref:hypothetical protein n=1 Tax=Pseudobutyrivibrio sp. UC1225 TaxID=1798185 RepID=UPI0008E4650E|nr:hypothetical protein [Pseudobutyrivibrio sp. UC1225]SFO14254.1 hypothetical protein SAMN04487831_10988 [Pseudobutyrivibrio sp. UC1225]
MKKYKKGLTNALLQFIWAVVGYIYLTVYEYDIFIAVILLITFTIFAWNNHDFVNTSLFFKINSLVFVIFMAAVTLLHLAAHFNLIPNMWWIPYTFAVSIVYTFAELIDFSGMEL